MTLIKKNFKLILLAIIALQMWVNNHFLYTKPEIAVTTPPPKHLASVINSMGDIELEFRKLGFELQYMGDTFGRSTSLYKYDFNLIEKWFYALDKLNDYSDFTPSIAAYYFGSVLDNQKKEVVINYLLTHSKDRIKQKWWWLYQASFLSYHFLHDEKRALEIGYMLNKTHEKIPIWARQLPAFYHEKRGEKEHAFSIMQNILETYRDISPHERNFINYFIKERLKDLEQAQ